MFGEQGLGPIELAGHLPELAQGHATPDGDQQRSDGDQGIGLDGDRGHPERSHQGFVEFAVALRVVRDQLSVDEVLLKDGATLIDSDTIGYYGNSQGGIYGAGYLGMSTDLTRGILGVPGAPYGLLLPRSADFDPYFLILKNKWEDHRDIAVNIALMSMIWEPTEGAGWLRAMNEDPAPEFRPSRF